MDRFRTAAAMVEAHRQAGFASPAVYRPSGSMATYPVDATISLRSVEQVDGSGALVRLRMASITVSKADYQPDPKAGDRIDVTHEGATITYTVGSTDTAQPVWTWADPFELARRISAFTSGRA